MTLQELYPKMKAACRQVGGSFGLVFWTHDRRRANKETERVCYNNCRFRRHERDEGKDVPADSYIFFTDLDTGEARKAWRPLVTEVRLNSTWRKIDSI